MNFARIAIAAVAVTTGWAGVMLAYHLIAPGAGDHDRALVRLWTGVYAGVAFVAVAVPVARSRKPATLAGLVLRGAVAGAGLTLLPPALYLFPWTCIAGGVAGALAAMTYASLLSLLQD